MRLLQHYKKSTKRTSEDISPLGYDTVLIRNKLLKFYGCIYLFIKFNIQAIHILLDIEIVKTECKLQNRKKVPVIYKMHVCLNQDIRGVTGGTDQTSGGCSLCYTIPI